MNIEPFGYFRALPFGWDSCGENDEGAILLYDQETVDGLLAEINTLNEKLENAEEALAMELAGEDW